MLRKRASVEIARLALAGGYAWCLMAACQEPAPRASPRRPLDSVAARPLEADASSAPRIAPADASDAGTSLEWIDAGVAPSLPERCATPPCATPRRVRCGDGDCILPKICYRHNATSELPEWQCLDRIKNVYADPRMLRAYECDDNADCAPGTVCCEHALGLGGAVRACAKKPCPGRPACVRGGTCERGFRCLDDVGDALRGESWSGATCVAEVASVRCGSHACAAEERCFVGDDTAECVPRTRWAVAAAASIIECTGPSDCGPGYSCCQAKVANTVRLPETYCAGQCVAAGIVCRDDNDCMDAGTQRAACGHDLDAYGVCE